MVGRKGGDFVFISQLDGPSFILPVLSGPALNHVARSVSAASKLGVWLNKATDEPMSLKVMNDDIECSCADSWSPEMSSDKTSSSLDRKSLILRILLLQLMGCGTSTSDQYWLGSAVQIRKPWHVPLRTMLTQHSPLGPPWLAIRWKTRTGCASYALWWPSSRENQIG